MKKNKKMQSKLLGFMIPVVIVAFAIVILIAYFSSKSTIQDKTGKLLASEATTSANAIEAWANKNIGILQTAVNSMTDLKMNEQQILEYEGFYLETYDDFPNGIYISSIDGKVYDATGWVPEYDVHEATWYNEGLSHEKMAFGEPYIDDYTGGYVVTASCNVPAIDGAPGVICADISLDILSQVVATMEVEGEGDALIIDSGTGIILASVNPDLVGKTVAETGDAFYTAVLEKAKNADGKADSIASNNGKYMVSCENIEGTSWVVVVRALESKIYKDIRALGALMAFLGILGVVIIVVILIIFVKRIVSPITKLTNTIVAVTDGDFTADVVVKGNDEVSVMAGSMKNFVESMRQTLGSIMNISDRIDTQAQGSNVISGELHDSASGQAEAMSQMRDNLEELVESIGVIAENATTLAIVVADTNEAGEQAIENIESTMQAADDGRNSMNAVTVSMNEMKDGMDSLEKSITNVGSAALKINEITATIRDIADETNLLALNASIEAARAGDSGRGFAVVATQIKQLAETSGAAAGEISKLIESVTELIEGTVAQSHESVENIKNSTDKVYEAAEQFNQIYEKIEGTNGIVNGMIQKVREANDVAANMAAITEEQSASAEEIEATAVSIQELANHVTENSSSVKEDSNNLAETAATLKEKISGFTIE